MPLLSNTSKDSKRWTALSCPRLDADTQFFLGMRHYTVIPLHTFNAARGQLHVESHKQVGQDQVHLGVGKASNHVSFSEHDVPEKVGNTYVLPMQSVRPFENASTQ